MAYTEDLARVWLEQNPEGYLYYSAEPLYERAELVCRNVIVNVRSSDGTIDQQVIVYNAAKGYMIDYATGRFARE
jgi:DNA-entry nuclease